MSITLLASHLFSKRPIPFLADHLSKRSVSPQDVWNVTKQHSEDYFRKLELSQNDFEGIESFIQSHSGISPDPNDHIKAAFLKLEIEDKQFSCYVHHTCGADYGESWTKTIQVACDNDSSLNASAGMGTAFINRVPEEWHQKILDMMDETIKHKLHQEINSIIHRNHNLWGQMIEHSKDYSSKLELSQNDLECIKSFIQSNSGIFPDLNDHIKSAFLKLEIEDKQFSCYVHHTCGADYGKSWTKTIQVACDSDSSLNASAGMGTAFINRVPEKWHQKILDRMDEKMKIELHQEIDAVTHRNHNLWGRVLEHSKDYSSKLELSQNDFKCIESFIQESRGIFPDLNDHIKAAFLKFEIEDKQFSCYVHHTCGADYGGSWTKTIQVACDSDSSLNANTGRGTTFINRVPEKWHQKILDKMDEKIKHKLHQEIDAVTHRNHDLWDQATQYSKEYMEKLQLSEDDLEVLSRGHQKFRIDLEIEGKKFYLRTRSICGVVYGGSWRNLIEVYCSSDQVLNANTGRGTTFINTVPVEWHRKILGAI